MTTLLSFDDIIPGKLVSNQYKPDGIVFTSKAQIALDENTPSGRKVLVSQVKAGGEYPVYYISAKFTNPHHSHISFWASSPTGRGCSGMITARDVRGKQVATYSFGGSNGWTSVELFSTTANISSIEIHGSSRSSFDRIDSLSFDNPSSPQIPNFQPAYTNTEIDLPLRPSAISSASATTLMT